jgi:O-antigen/teichoic acid export membrane protein
MAGNVIRRLLGTGLRLVVAFVSVPVYVHLIGMSQWGLLALFQAAAAPLALLDLGTSPALVKRVSEALGRNDEDGALRSVRAALLFNAGLLVAGSSVLLFLAPWFARSYFAIPEADVSVAMRGFRVVAFSWASGIVLGFFSTALVARQRYDEVLRASTLAMATSTGAGLAAAAATRDASWVLLGQSIGTVVAAAFAWHRVRRVFPRFPGGLRWEGAELRRLLAFGSWQTTANVGVLLATWSDRYVLGAFFAPRVVGFYSLAQSLYQQLYSVFFDAGDVLFPAVSHRQGMGELSSARRLALLAGWALTSAFGPAAVTLAVLGGDFVHVWISPEAADASRLVLRLLCAGAIASMAGVAPILFAMGTGRPQLPAPFTVVVGLVSAGISLVLVPRIGLAGIGIAFLAANAVRWGFLLVLGHALFREDVSPREFFLHVFAPPLVSLGSLASLVALHDASTHTPGWGRFALEVVAVFLAAAALQVVAGEALPGGAARRRDVVGSFRPIVATFLARVRGSAPR